MLGLYRGFWPTLLRDVPEIAIQFTLYERCEQATTSVAQKVLVSGHCFTRCSVLPEAVLMQDGVALDLKLVSRTKLVDIIVDAQVSCRVSVNTVSSNGS